jgi:hypothetical protein
MNIADQIKQLGVWVQELGTNYSAEQGNVLSLIKHAKMPIVGINTHLFSDPAYKDVDKVIGCINKLGIKYVRQDFFVDETGKMTNTYPYEKFLEAGIEVRPMVYAYKLDTAGIKEYDKGFAVGRGFAALYGTMFKEIELGNELAIKCLISGKTGDKKEHYDAKKLAAVCEYVRGMYMGVLSTGRPLKMIVNCEWLHTYFIDTLRADYGVCTSISHHWYTDSQANAGNFIKQEIEHHLRDKYGEYFEGFGEMNYMPGTGFSESAQVEKLLPLLTRVLSAGCNVYLFELLDRSDSKGREGNLGLFRSDGTPKLIVEKLMGIL